MSEIALEDLFDKMHRLQAETFITALEKGEVSPQMHNAINKFLSDNNVTGIKAENSSLKKLSDGLAAYEEGDNIHNIFPR